MPLANPTGVVILKNRVQPMPPDNTSPLDELYAQALREVVTELCQREPETLTAFGDEKPSLSEDLSRLLWGMHQVDGTTHVPASMVFLDFDPRKLATTKAIPLGPVEVIDLLLSDQLVLRNGESIFCPGFTVKMPGDGRRGGYSLERLADGALALVLFEYRSMVEEGDRCAVFTKAD